MGLAVDATGLRRSHGRTPVLRGLDLQLPQGTLLGLAGANGSGKTTLLAVLSTILRAQGGELRILGHVVPVDRALVRPRIGLVGHASYLYPQLTVEENMAFYATMYGLDATWRNSLEELLSRLGLEKQRQQLVVTLSRGLLQRAALVRALLHSPDLLLLDEPFTALDPASTTAVSNLLRAWQQEGKTAILTTHDVDRDRPLCTEVRVLDRGRLGPPS